MSSHNVKTSNPNIHLSETQLMSYHTGRMKNAEMHLMELHLSECELCRDALEGYELLDSHESSEALNDLRGQLAKRLEKENDKKTTILWFPMAIAASVLLILSFAAYFIINQTDVKRNNLAKQEKLEQTEIADNPLTNSTPAIVDQNTEVSDEVKAQEKKQLPIPKKEKETRVENQREEMFTVKENIETEKPIALNEPSQAQPIIKEPSVRSVEKERIKAGEPRIALKEESEKKQADASSARSAPSMDFELETGNSSTASIKGKVIGEDGVGLPGVSVVLKGTTIGTITDADGNYELPVPSGNPVLSFNFIGYNANEVRVTNTKNVLNIKMQPDLAMLSEVVVTGYSTEGAKRSGNGKVFIAKPAGGIKSFREYIKENTKYTEEAMRQKTEGKVVVEFYVEADGSLSNMRIKKSLGHGLDEEAIRLVKEGPQWQPGTYNGEPIREQVEVKIPFRLK